MIIKQGQSTAVVVDGQRTRGTITKLHRDAGRLVGVSIQTGKQTVWRAVRNGAVVEET